MIKELCGDMDLASESHYKEYGLFTLMESRKYSLQIRDSYFPNL